MRDDVQSQMALGKRSVVLSHQKNTTTGFSGTLFNFTDLSDIEDWCSAIVNQMPGTVHADPNRPGPEHDEVRNRAGLWIKACADGAAAAADGARAARSQRGRTSVRHRLQPSANDARLGAEAIAC